MARQNDTTVTIDGKRYDADTIREAIEAAIIGRAPVGIMSDTELRDGIANRLLWSLAIVTLIAQGADADTCITDAADATVLHLEQARDMFRALTAVSAEDESPASAS